MADSDLQAIPEGLFGQIRTLIGEARQQALRAVDVVQVRTCWQIGRHIVELEQNGAERAMYGARLLPRLAERLTAENVPVILTSTMAAPERNSEGYDGRYNAPAQLYAAGVRFAIAGGSGGLYSYRLPWEAGVAVAFGLPEEEALKAVTINAAEFMGIADKVGSLEVGKQATLLITTGTPLDMTSNVEQSYIQGREIDMNDIHKQFFKKYLEKIRQQMGRIAM